MEQETEIEAKANKEVSKDEVMQAALRLFAKKGYFNTSLTDIKDAVGLKTNSGIHQHFKTKQAIAQSLHEQILDSLSISVDDIRRRNRHASEQLREIVELLFKLTDDAPEIMQFLFFVRSDEFLTEPQPLLESAAFNKIKRIVQNGIRDGEIRAIDPLLAYTYFFGIIQQTLAMVLSGDLTKSAESYLAPVWLAAWGAIVKK